MANSYISRDDIKAYLGVNAGELAGKDATLDLIAEAVSRAVDDATGRRFWTGEETRYYTPRRANELWIDDLVSVTSLKTDSDGDGIYETTWTEGTDFELYPYNAALHLKPYSRLDRMPLGSYAFPVYRKSVQVIGIFGYWTSVPAPVMQACLQMATRFLKRADAPLGILGGSTFEAIRIATVDQDVRALIAPYMLIQI